MGPQPADRRQSVSMVRPDVNAAHLAAIVASSVDAILSQTLDGIILSWNAGAERMFGYSPAEIIGQPVTRLYSSERLEEEERIFERVKRGERLERYETVYLTKDGRPLEVGLTISQVHDITGRIVAASTIIRDLTERKRTEAQFGLLADKMPAMCWMAEANGWIFWYNRRWYEYTGTSPEQMQGWGWQVVHDPAILPQVLASWKACIETGQPFAMTFSLKGHDGVLRPFLTRVTPLRGVDGKVFRWLGVNIDVTEERRASELGEQFMAVLGHDLRNPLGAIVSGLALLRKTPLNYRAVRLADQMQSSADRMAALIDDIMDFARSRLGGDLPLNRAVVPLEPLLREVIGELVITMPERIVETDFALNEPVNCDRGRIAQLFSNLLGNALTYGSLGRPIRVRAVSRAEGFELSVANDGMPISPVDLPRLFQPFYRGEERPNRNGLGLGLYIAHEIAIAHGGMLEVTSTQEETQFMFRMPTIGSGA